MINTLNEINKMATTCPAEFIKSCNEEYLNSIRQIAQRISQDNNIKIVAIAGPSGSGKSTFVNEILYKNPIKVHHLPEM